MTSLQEAERKKMPLLNFGQPLGGIIQVAYVVEDIERSMQEFTRRLRIGPWFVTGPFTPLEGRYRGQPTDINLTLAVGFCGHMSFELIEQHNEAPSVYREIVEARGYGFHHWGMAAPDLDRAVEEHRAQGYEVAFSDRSPRGFRVVYMDTTRDLPGMIELLELTPSLEARYTEMYLASLGWDGSDPVRRGK